MSLLDDIKKAKCRCGAKAEKSLIGAGAHSISQSFLCIPCFNKTKEHARQIIELTGLSWFAVPPGLRPDDFKGEDINGRRKS